MTHAPGCRRDHEQQAQLDVHLFSVERIELEGALSQLRIGEDPVHVVERGQCVRGVVQPLPDAPADLETKIRRYNQEDERVQGERALVRLSSVIAASPK